MQEWQLDCHYSQSTTPEQLVSVIFTEQQRVQAINRQREQALEGIERHCNNYSNVQQLALLALRLLQQTLSPHLTN